MFPLQNAISTADELSVDLQRAKGKGFIRFGFMEVVTELSVNRTDEGEKEGMEMSASQELWWNW
jgi:hypothetical protein